MASGAEHYRRAEELLDQVNDIDPERFETVADFIAARTATELGAQVHATLALVAATVDANELGAWEHEETGASGITDWGKAVTES